MGDKDLGNGAHSRGCEIKAECVVARELLVARGDPDLIDDVATLDAYAAGFNEKGHYQRVAHHSLPRLQHPVPGASTDKALKKGILCREMRLLDASGVESAYRSPPSKA